MSDNCGCNYLYDVFRAFQARKIYEKWERIKNKNKNNTIDRWAPCWVLTRISVSPNTRFRITIVSSKAFSKAFDCSPSMWPFILDDYNLSSQQLVKACFSTVLCACPILSNGIWCSTEASLLLNVQPIQHTITLIHWERAQSFWAQQKHRSNTCLDDDLECLDINRLRVDSFQYCYRCRTNIVKTIERIEISMWKQQTNVRISILFFSFFITDHSLWKLVTEWKLGDDSNSVASDIQVTKQYRCCLTKMCSYIH